MSQENDDWDKSIEEYYSGFPDGDEKLEHYEKCGDCFWCEMDEHMAKNHNAYKRMGEL